MKISKLFHWLYAMVMFLPLFAIGITCAYVVFNKNAKDSYYGETINNVNYLEVSSSTFVENNDYLVRNSNTDLSSSVYFTFNGIENISISQTLPSSFEDYNNGFVYQHPSFNLPYMAIRVDTGGYSYLPLRNNGYEFILHNLVITTENNEIFDFLYFVEYNKYSYLDNAFYYSVHELKNNQFFNWAKSSFLAQPITYITDLFGMDSDNFVIYLLSYWLDISIIWLTFDVVMYVPLLVHRWLDKGVLE